MILFYTIISISLKSLLFLKDILKINFQEDSLSKCDLSGRRYQLYEVQYMSRETISMNNKSF